MGGIAMRITTTRIGLVSTALLVATSACALGAFDVQSALVTHFTRYTGQQPTSAVVLNVGAPVAPFNTVGADSNGAIGTFSASTITLHSQSSSLFDARGSAGLYNTGSIHFTSDTAFELTPQLIDAHLIGSYDIGVRNTQTNQEWRWGTPNSPVPEVYGDLASPAPAGQYELTWSHTPLSQQSQNSSETYELTLTSVPEPMSAGLLPAVLLTQRRARKANG
jgi:hypothetical protein